MDTFIILDQKLNTIIRLMEELKTDKTSLLDVLDMVGSRIYSKLEDENNDT